MRACCTWCSYLARILDRNFERTETGHILFRIAGHTVHKNCSSNPAAGQSSQGTDREAFGRGCLRYTPMDSSDRYYSRPEYISIVVPKAGLPEECRGILGLH